MFQPDDVPVLLNASTIQLVTHMEFRMLEQLKYELATLTLVAWVDIFRRRLSLCQQQQQQRSRNIFLMTHEIDNAR